MTAQQLLDKLISPGLRAAKSYKIDRTAATIKLDQNESPFDWHRDFKKSVCDKLQDIAWNRYPEPIDDDLTELIAQSIGCKAENVLTGPGSNYLIAILINAFGRFNTGKIVIARPSFVLYESHCASENLPYLVWPLDQNLDYQLDLLPAMPPGSLLLFASPNNPVGNVLSRQNLKTILQNNPQSLIVADEAYVEYTDEQYTDLLSEFPNLLLVRTFSKTVSAAGVRLGILVGHAAVIDEVKKLRLPYLLNQFTLVAAREVLTNKTMQQKARDTVAATIAERVRVFAIMQKLASKYDFFVKESNANFILARWSTPEKSLAVYHGLLKKSVLVRNVGGSPGLAGSLRMTIGTPAENTKLLAALEAALAE